MAEQDGPSGPFCRLILDLFGNRVTKFDLRFSARPAGPRITAGRATNRQRLRDLRKILYAHPRSLAS